MRVIYNDLEGQVYCKEVFDNADLLLDDELRKYICLDTRNQYLIIGRSPANLLATKENFYELQEIREGEKFVFKLVRVFD